MPILYSSVSRGTIVLAKHAACAGNFSEVCEQVLQRVAEQDNKLTYSHSNYFFHYVCNDQITYLCVTDAEFDRSLAFSFLQEIQNRFQRTYGERAKTSLPYAMNSDFSMVLSAEMKAYSNNTRSGSRASNADDLATDSKLSSVQAQVDQLKTVMVKNIDAIAERGEKLELLVDRSNTLDANSVSFRTRSRHLSNALWWKNLKIAAFLFFIGAIIVFIIVTASCGGFAYPNC